MDEAIPISIRATAYELLAFTFRFPGPELAEAAASGEWADAAREVAEALALELPEGWGEGLAGYGGARCRGAAARAARRGDPPVRGRARAGREPLRGRVASHRRRGAGAPVREPPLDGGRALHEVVRGGAPRGHKRASGLRRRRARVPAVPVHARGGARRGARGRPCARGRLGRCPRPLPRRARPRLDAPLRREDGIRVPRAVLPGGGRASGGGARKFLGFLLNPEPYTSLTLVKVLFQFECCAEDWWADPPILTEAEFGRGGSVRGSPRRRSHSTMPGLRTARTNTTTALPRPARS